MSFCIKDLPKVELHVHLDCCLSFKGLSRIDPTISESFYKKNFIGTSCSCLKDYIRCADTALEYMQTKEQLEIVVEDLFDQLTNDNVIYAEIRFAPLLHQKKGLSSKNVVEIVSNKTKIESEKLKALSDEYNIPQSEIAREGIRYISNRQAKMKNKKK